MVQITEIKENTANRIDTHSNISKKEINEIKEINDLFNSIYDTLSDDQKDKIELRIYEIKSIFDYYAKKKRRGKKLSKAQLNQLNKQKLLLKGYMHI